MKVQAGIIFGGASGIGLAVTDGLLAAGHKVVVVDRNVAGLETRQSDSLKLLEADISVEETGARAVEACKAAFGTVDFGVNAAGISIPPQDVSDIRGEDFRRLTEINYFGCFYAMAACLKAMRGAGAGSYVNIASTAGIKPFSRSGPYSASKAAMIALSASAAIESAPDGVRINVVCPGVTDTPMYRAVQDDQASRHLDHVPLRRIAAPSEIADAVIWLIGDQASYVTGATIPVDGGLARL